MSHILAGPAHAFAEGGDDAFEFAVLGALPPEPFEGLDGLLGDGGAVAVGGVAECGAILASAEEIRAGARLWSVVVMSCRLLVASVRTPGVRW